MSDMTPPPKTRTRSRAPLVGLPSFKTPDWEATEPKVSGAPLEPPPHYQTLTGETPAHEGHLHVGATASLPSDADGTTRTGTWGTSRNPTAAETKTTVKMVSGIAKLAIVLTDVLLGRASRQLRRPTPEQLEEFATPVGAIVARHFDVAKLGLDVADLTTAGGAFGDWMSEGPVTLPKGPNVVQVGMPEPDPFVVHPAAEEYAAPIPGQTEIDLSGPVQFLP